MRLRNIYNQSLSGKGQSSFSGKLYAGVAACILFALVFASPAKAQTSVSRTTSILAGTAPGSPSSPKDSLWTFNVSDYSIRTRLAPTITAGPITGTITGINGLATHPVTKVHYAILKVTGQANRILATINLQTGFCTTIGSLGDKFSTLAFNANGSLFGVTGNGATVPETMFRINSATAATSLFRPLGSGADGEIIAYNTDNNKFYHWSGNGTVVWERFDTSGTDAIQTLTYTGTLNGETFGALYLGSGNILTSNINSEFKIWDTLGNISAPVATGLPDNIRGIVRQTITSTISASGSTTICSGTSVVLSVTGATGNYQWYQNGGAISGATSSTYSASASGIYNCRYTDINGFTDSTASGIPVIVKQTPSLNSGLTPPGVCNNTLFTYTATSATSGTSFSWTRTAISGITPSTGSGGTSISETLTNTTTDPITVTYVYSLTANGCPNIQSVIVVVNPTPALFPTPLVPSICSGSTYSFTQNSLTTPSPTYSWTRAAISGISPATSSGTGNISNVLTNTTPNPITVIYADTLIINGCKNTEFLSVIVKPIPVLTSSLTPTPICDNGVFDYNPTSLTSSVSYTWTRPILPTISNSFGSGNDTINEHLDNITDNPVTVTYPITLTANLCSNTQNVNVIVYPTPRLSTTLTPEAKCDSIHFQYVPHSYTTSGVSYAWSRLATVGINNGAASGTDTISEWLDNTVSYPVPVTYVYTLTVGTCTNTQSVVVVSNPTPVLSNTPIPATPICDSTLFSFQPTSTTIATAYAWHRGYIEGINALAQDGMGNPNEILDNTTNTNLTVVYVYTLTANGCSHVQSVPVLVRPTPTFISIPTDSACSAVPYTYQPLTGTIPASSVTYTWSRIPTVGITPFIAGGNGNISETLVNATTNPLYVTYLFTLSIGAPGNTCTNTGKVIVKVRPSATAPVITTMPPAALCMGTMYQNFGVATAAPVGQTYTWSAANATIQATGLGGQYALVNFTSSGIATVTVTSKIGTTGCIGTAPYYVTVTGNNSSTPYVIYNSGKFVCLQNDVKSFQWGYDDASTLDSVLLAGETGQSYFNTTAAGTFASRNYWVITSTSDNCMQKTYYDKAPGGKIITEDNTGFAEMKVFPNPASDNINVEINTTATGNIAIEIVNMVGQAVNTISTTNHNTSMNISHLPAGMYMVNSYIDGNKVGTAKFLKN